MRFVEWYLGIPQAAPGTDRRWMLEFASPWAAAFSHPAMLIVLGALLVGCVALCLRETRGQPLWCRGVLCGLRGAVLLLSFLLLTGATLRIEQMGRPALAVLIDTSASMQFSDRYAPDELAASVRPLLTESTRTLPRFVIVQQFLGSGDPALLDVLDQRFSLRVYRFGERAAALAPDLDAGGNAGGDEGGGDFGGGDFGGGGVGGGGGDDSGGAAWKRSGGISEDTPPATHATPGPQRDRSAAWSARLAKLAADEPATRCASAVRFVLDDMQGGPVAGLVVLTDGIATPTDDERLSLAAVECRRQAIPMFVAGIGSQQAARDVELDDVHADRFAFLGDPVLLTASVRATGLNGRAVTLVLRDTAANRELDRTTVTLPDNDRSLPVELQFIPDRVGTIEVVVSIEPVEGESNSANNRLSRTISVRENRLRVLLADNQPRWEFRELKALLEREPTVELHTVLQDADPEFAEQDQTARPIQGRFPTAPDALQRYDVIVFGDLNVQFLSDSVRRTVVDFVRAGGGLILVAGPQFNPVTYGGTPLAEVLPFAVNAGGSSGAGNDAAAARLPVDVGFRPRVTPAGAIGTTLFRFNADRSSVDRGLPPSLPELYWFVPTANLKPGTSVLLEHPRPPGRSEPLPIISVMRFGRGRVLFHATDELWRWRRPAQLSAHAKYWIQALRWLSRSDGDDEFEFTADRNRYELGEVVRFRLIRSSGGGADAGRMSVVVELPNGTEKTLEGSARPESPDVWEAEFRPSAAGRYHARLIRPASKSGPAAVDFRVETTDREHRERRLARDDLQAAARISRGQYYGVADLDRLTSDLPQGQAIPLGAPLRRPLWNRWEWLIFATLLLGTEWAIRRRRQLL